MVTSTTVKPTSIYTQAVETAPLLTQTPAPPTPTPHSPIPTFAATFDVRTIITATPAPAATCPAGNPDRKANFKVPDFSKCTATEDCFPTQTPEEILEFLNLGGTIDTLIKKFEDSHLEESEAYIYRDLTNDGVPEFMFFDFSMFSRIHFFTCSEGHYELFVPEMADPASMHFDRIQDMNGNGIPDLVLTSVIQNNAGGFGVHIF